MRRVGKNNEYEIDFIAKKNHKIQYFQVAYLLNSESTIESEFRVLEKIKDNHPKYVLSLDKIDFSRNGIQHKNVIDFLLE
ncbi:ATP-binding protein [Acidaminobacter sp. JC074]|nr:ATP-binding protein [Acidaminobacter sp. JC074]